VVATSGRGGRKAVAAQPIKTVTSSKSVMYGNVRGMTSSSRVR